MFAVCNNADMSKQREQKRPTGSVSVGLRLSDELVAQVDEVARRQMRTRSSVLRMALLALLDLEVSKGAGKISSGQAA